MSKSRMVELTLAEEIAEHERVQYADYSRRPGASVHELENVAQVAGHAVTVTFTQAEARAWMS